MEHLISPPEAAKRVGVSDDTIRAWMHRSENPLPSIPVGKSGKFRRIIVAEIDSWLSAEAQRTAASA